MIGELFSLFMPAHSYLQFCLMLANESENKSLCDIGILKVLWCQSGCNLLSERTFSLEVIKYPCDQCDYE